MGVAVLGGTLIRRGHDQWEWADRTPEPRAKDASPDRWNFRCRTTGASTYVEVLRGLAQETDGLAWVLKGARAGQYRTGQSGDHIGPIVIDEEAVRRANIRPGEDPLRGNEPMPEIPGPIPAVILVPIDEWRAWCRDNPAGAQWDLDHEEEILARARSLGWDPRA